METEHLVLEMEPPIARITLDRPDRLNALAVRTWGELRDALETADENEEIRAIVLAGNGKAFCSGDDISDFEFESAGDARAYAKHILSCGLTIERVETPVIAKVHGLAHGGGCEIAAIADVTIASRSASFRLPESLVGAVPGIGLVRFPELIGLKRTRELMLTNRELDADEARDVGLVDEVTDDDDELDALVEKRAGHIAKTAPMSTRLIKRILNSRFEDEAAAVNALTLIFTMDDIVEGMDAFFAERDPQWEDA